MHVNLGSVFCIMIIFMFYVGVLSSLIVLSLIVVIIIITHRRAHSQVGQLSRLQHSCHAVGKVSNRWMRCPSTVESFFHWSSGWEKSAWEKSWTVYGAVAHLRPTMMIRKVNRPGIIQVIPYSIG